MHPTIATTSRLSDETTGMLLGLAGVAIFSMTLPFTRMAVAGFDPAFVALGRALAAATLAALWLAWNRAPLPPRAAWKPLAWVALGCVVGFPWLTSMAMRSLPASHGAVLIGMLPLATAAYAALRGYEKPSPAFWLMAAIGTALVAGFALLQSGGTFHLADLAVFAAVLLGAAGYAEGGKLSKTMGGERVISWALILSVPVVLPAVAWLVWRDGAAIAAAGWKPWTGFAYISVFSMYIGFFFWYRGMALGGVARVGQVQLLQPFLTMAGAALVLSETISLSNILFALAVISVVATGRRTRIRA
ncbi:DMT family transporter [Pseudoduganella ginsengisoli]|nr:DMT family transporter [Pseudoduganella ginsengisoli]